ncbi:MAG: type IV secretory system conjugative DNA transfer family protein [bacterium]|nr:type IV secretory system conjugative DNA transfer family protein [bacterium]
MFQFLEELILVLAKAFYSLPAIVGVFTLGAAALILLVVQFTKQHQTFVPGFFAFLFGILELFHYLWPVRAIRFIDSLILSIHTPVWSRTSMGILEPIFSLGVGPYQNRNILEETVFIAFVAYLISVVIHGVKDPTSSIANTTSGSGFWSLFSNSVIRPQRSTSNELGSGDFATNEQIAKWVTPSGKEGDTLLAVEDLRGAKGTAFKKATLRIPRGERNRHILAVAKTGSGKTTKLILPILYNDCLDPVCSTIVIDSKPEMWKKLAGMTRKYNPGKEILLFNPLDLGRSLSWNILAKIETDTDAKLIANTIIQATDNPSAKQDSPFFRNNALAILNAIFIGLLNDPKEYLSMPRVHQLVQCGNKNLAAWLEAHPKSIRNTKTFVDLVKSGSQNADTIMSELSMRLSAWDLEAIRATTSKHELDLETLITKPTLFIVELRESELEMLRPLANVIVTEILRFLTKRAESFPGTCLPRPVGLVIDEFSSALGRLPDIHVKLNTLRSRNVSITAAVQSLAQIQANYQDDGESVIAGFSSKIFMPNLDVSDAEWASKESGQMTVRFKTNSTGSNKKLTEVFASKNDGSQEQVQQRAVLTPDEIGKPSDNIATFFMPNTPVFQGFLIPHFQIPEMLSRISEFDTEKFQLNLRNEALTFEETPLNLPPPPGAEASTAAPGATNLPGTGVRPGISDTRGWTDEQILKKMEEIKARIEWDKTTGSARKWWLAFENENKHRLALVLRLAEELDIRKATITEFFLAYVYSNTDNIQANLNYLDYTRLKRQEEEKKRKARADAAKQKSDEMAATGGTSGTAQADSGETPDVTTTDGRRTASGGV